MAGPPFAHCIDHISTKRPRRRRTVNTEQALRFAGRRYKIAFEEKSLDAYVDLKAFLEKLFGCRVDLVLGDAIKPRLRLVILETAVYAAGSDVYYFLISSKRAI
jgi:hypothetical protein